MGSRSCNLVFVGLFSLCFLLHRDFKISKIKNTDPPKNVVTISEDDEDDELELTSEKIACLWILAMMIVLGAASHLLVKASLALGDMLGIDGVIMGFVVIAAGTSVPDTALSVQWRTNQH